MEKTIATAFFEAYFADGDPAPRGEVELLVVLNQPAAMLTQHVDTLPRNFFRRGHNRGRVVLRSDG
jgi:hypothetical protein